MKKSSLKAATMLLTAALLLSGCGSSANQPGNIPSPIVSNDTSDSVSSTKPDSDTSNEPITSAPANTGKLSFEEIEQLAADCAFNIHWYTSTEGDYSAGTGFLMDSDTFGEKLLVTAFHFLVPDDTDVFTGNDLQNYVTGGRIYSSKSGEYTGATIRNNVIISDADAVPHTEKDVAAFTVQNAEGLRTLPLSTHKTKSGDTLYLLADCSFEPDRHENCVYRLSASIVEKDLIAYLPTENKDLETRGASGCPIINEYGEVVAIHMASGGGMLIGHCSGSFINQIDNGKISDITYPDDSFYTASETDITDYTDTSDNSDNADNTGEDDDIPMYYYGIGDRIGTDYFDFSVDKYKYRNKVGSTTAPEGMRYLILDITFDGTGYPYDTEMYSEDFFLYTDEMYLFPVEEKLSDSQLDSYYIVYKDMSTSGKLIFEVPETSEYAELVYYDYYIDENSTQIFTACHCIDIPVE